VLEQELGQLVAEHPSVARARSFGLFGCLDLVDKHGRSLQRL
jgi:adenosylmethionine-8-amino-7-oxononanoate aminotransferase